MHEVDKEVVECINFNLDDIDEDAIGDDEFVTDIIKKN